jgi:hypothetical protein
VAVVDALTLSIWPQPIVYLPAGHLYALTVVSSACTECSPSKRLMMDSPASDIFSGIKVMVISTKIILITL